MSPKLLPKHPMIPAPATTGQHLPFADDLWGPMLAGAVRQLDDLLAQLQLDRPAMAGEMGVDPNNPFPVRVPQPYLDRMQPGDPHDPLLRQVLPLMAERANTPGLSHDPLAEADAVVTPGLLQKYQGRALVVTTGACAIHCRYCFRRHFPYNNHGPAQYAGLLEAVAADASIEEVILSGGDPLTLSDAAFESLVDQLTSIPHVKRLRIHSRLPIVLPQRVNQRLVNYLQQLTVPVVLVVHANHANELDALTQRALAALHHPNITLLNQSVLLRGVNDTANSLAALSQQLFQQGVLPYYLHLPDRVQGTEHFRLTAAEAQPIHTELAAMLPGYLLPKLVQELPGQASKTAVR